MAQILAFTDGSQLARSVIRLLYGFGRVDVQMLTHASKHHTQSYDLVVVALDTWHQRLLDRLPKLLAASGYSNTPQIFCMSFEDKVRLARRLSDIPAKAASVPITREALFEHIHEIAPSLRGECSGRAAKAQANLQSVGHEFVFAFEGAAIPPADTIAALSQATTLIDEALDILGFDAWLATIEQHHSYTARHCMSVAGFASQWAQCLGCSPRERARLTEAALLHDVGKINVPIEILDKPIELDDDQRILIESHAADGCAILSAEPTTSALAKDVALSHHELLDGSGYPHGIGGSEISDPIRCMTIVDIYSALVDRRAYKPPMDPFEVLDVMRSMTGKVDMTFLDAFRPIVEAHQKMKAAAAA